MLKSQTSRMIQCVIIDVNTQWDFCDRKGAQPVSNLKALIPALRRVIAWTKRNGAPVISSVESQRPLELTDSGNPICCVDGSGGQCKMDFTMFPRRTHVELDTTLSLPVNPFRRIQQVIFRKRGEDLLLNPKADRLFTYLPVKEYIVFGTGLEGAVKSIVLSLLTRERKVSVIVDACGYWHKQLADLTLRQLQAKGASLITVDDLLQRKLNHRYRLRYRKSLIDVDANGQSFTPSAHRSEGNNGHARHNPDHNGHKPVRRTTP